MFTNEKSDTQSFWLALIRDTFGIKNPEDYIKFEKRVKTRRIKFIDDSYAKFTGARVNFIDAYIPDTRTLIEQKSLGGDLDEAFFQAKHYYDWLPFSEKGRYIITCDFNEMRIYDMEFPVDPPEIIFVSDITRDKLGFLLNPEEPSPREINLSIKAGELVRKLYDSLRLSLDDIANRNNYTKEQRSKAIDDINIFCVRLVFILYAEDAGLFTKHQFHDYIEPKRSMAREAMIQLFKNLNIPRENRDLFIDQELREFSYVNGGLFQETVNFPVLDEASIDIIIHDMSEGFDWSGISPTIFGAIFESTLNEETRKQEGIHYTSLSNIHKVIDPLFLDELRETLNNILSEPYSPVRTINLCKFQDKLAALRFLDPACGSGNFLTESFISLRRLENKLLAAIPEADRPPVKVSITQFHGIESHNFAVNIAKAALWISDHQMWKETCSITGTSEPPLPLKDYHHIKEGSAMDTLENLGWAMPGWKIPHDDMLYIMGNPPFVGRAKQSEAQKEEVRRAFGNGKIDYAACWFWLAAEYVQDKNTKAAFVTTNSLTQGEQAGYVFNRLSERWGIKIDFACQSFEWKNELPDPSKMAQVHVVVIGISTNPPELRKLYTADGLKLVKNINFYLADGPDEDIAEERDEPISPNVPAMTMGNMPADGGNLLIKGKDYAEFISREPRAAKYIKRCMGGDELLNNIPRYCLWLVDATHQEIRSMPLVSKRVEACRKLRLESSQPRLADTPHLFREQMNPAHYIAIPEISSEKRIYIPMAWLDDSVIATDRLRIIQDATIYNFGVLTSRVHMAWVRRVCGRFEMRYTYSKNVVYNTFPWPSPTKKQLERITQTAQAILDARANNPDCTLATMYDDVHMPPDLRRAHRANDAAVCKAYGWDAKITDDEIVSGLFVLYHRLTGK